MQRTIHVFKHGRPVHSIQSDSSSGYSFVKSLAAIGSGQEKGLQCCEWLISNFQSCAGTKYKGDRCSLLSYVKLATLSPTQMLGTTSINNARNN